MKPWHRLGLCLLLAAGALAYLSVPEDNAERARGRTSEQAPTTARAPRSAARTDERITAPRASTPAAVLQNNRAAAAPLDDAPHMAHLRQSFGSEPLETLEKARALEQALPNSQHAAERGWIIVRSLVNLGRFHEARDEAYGLVKRFPETEWALDVQRHLLVNPLDYPSREELAQAEASH